MQSKTNINLEVDVEYDILDPLDGPDIPLQIDITGVFVKIPSSQNKARRVNILAALSESEIIAVEDDILTPEFIDNYFRVKAWRSSHE
jgi:hypothetical protein